MKKIALAALFAAAVSASPASAQSAFQGFHVGINGGATMSDIETNVFGTKFDLATQGFIGGGSLGYMFSFSQGWLLDIEGIIDYSNSNSTFGGSKLEQGLGYGGAASIGYMISRSNAVYGKVGYEFQEFKAATDSKYLGGILLGAGSRWAIDENWSVKAEYNYVFSETTSIGGISVKPTSNAVRLGVDYRFY